MTAHRFHKNLYIPTLILALLVGAGIYVSHWRGASPSGITPSPTSMSNAGVLPDISSPAGWEAQRVDPSRIDFVHLAATRPLHERIEVSAYKSRNTIEEQIKSLGEDHSFDSSKTWNSFNGRLILATEAKEDLGTSFTYYVLGRNQLYTFTLLPYRFYDLEAKAWLTPNPTALQVTKTMVEAFAANAD